MEYADESKATGLKYDKYKIRARALGEARLQLAHGWTVPKS